MLQIFENAVRIHDSAAIPPSRRTVEQHERAAAAAKFSDLAHAAHLDSLRAETADERAAAISRREKFTAAAAAIDLRRRAPVKRGTVQSFSVASRRRLQRLLSCLRWSELGDAAFVTLTYHDVPPNWLENFRAWLQQLRRQKIKYIWRLEWQRRGAPHWHLILWNAADADEQLSQLRASWHAIAAHGSEAHHEYGWHQRPVDSFRAARAYLSKYVAKADPAPPPPEAAGRRVWGASRDLPTDPQIVGDLSRKNFFTLRRITRRLLRARARARGSKWKPFARNTHWIYLPAQQILELVLFLKIPIAWKDSGILIPAIE